MYFISLIYVNQCAVQPHRTHYKWKHPMYATTVRCTETYRVCQKKVEPQTHNLKQNSVKYEPIKQFFLGKFVVKWILKLPSHLAYVATLPCETLMSTKQAINDKLQGSITTYLKCDRVINNQIKKCLLVILRLKIL